MGGFQNAVEQISRDSNLGKLEGDRAGVAGGMRADLY
jgi:hypothetical protein